MSQQAEIINIAVNIFQNVGIKRWIQQIESLMNQQIYLEICKIIFPQNMIKLFKIGESHVSAGKKIQQVIDMIGNIIKLDLYHISGEMIAQGNLAHLRNFLQLLEALSQTFFTANREDVHTAPVQDINMNQSIEHGHYTVLGINKEFQTKNIDSYNYLDLKDQENPAEEQGPLKPKNPETEKKSPAKCQKKVRFKQEKQVKRKPSRTQKEIKKAYNNKSLNSYGKQKRENIPLNQSLIMKKVNYVQKINHIIQELQKNKIRDQQYLFKARKQNASYRHSRAKQMIVFQSGQRTRLINSKIPERQKTVQSLNGQNQAIKLIMRMFKKQKVYERQNVNARHAKMIEQADQIMNSDDMGPEMLKLAILSSIMNTQVMNQ